MELPIKQDLHGKSLRKRFILAQKLPLKHERFMSFLYLVRHPSLLNEIDAGSMNVFFFVISIGRKRILLNLPKVLPIACMFFMALRSDTAFAFNGFDRFSLTRTMYATW